MTEAAETVELFGLKASMSRAACETIASAHAAMKDQGLAVTDGYRGFVPVLARRLAKDL